VLVSGHLRKTESGHLARVTNGHLRRCADILRCGCALPATTYVTFTGLAMGFASYNGKQALVNPGTGCTWGAYAGTPPLLYLTPKTGGWYVFLQPALGFIMRFDRTCNLCEPAGSYTRTTCLPTADCDASSGATCVVSLT
jgi:hypothetical protein